jgi:iron complex transport system ATP-binding protein
MGVIKVRGLNFSYGDRPVLRNVDFDVARGEVVFLLGPNGSGKSTLLKLAAGIFCSYEGEIYLEGRNVSDYTKKELSRVLGIVLQSSSIDYEFTVEEAVAMGRYSAVGFFESVSPEDEVLRRAMIETDVMDLRHRIVTEISGGELARVMIARALAQEPRVLLLDEATGPLDLQQQEEVMEILRRRNLRDGTTLLLVSHDVNLAARFADRLVLMAEGAVAAEGTPEKVLTTENISKVYKTKVAVEWNSYYNRPQVFPMDRDRTRKAGE